MGKLIGGLVRLWDKVLGELMGQIKLMGQSVE